MVVIGSKAHIALNRWYQYDNVDSNVDAALDDMIFLLCMHQGDS